MSTKQNFLTIKQNGQHETVIKKSRFIASFARTETLAQAQDFIQKVSQKYRDANHNTYAYTIGLDNNQVKASDNGEPSGTAGVPELKALEMMKLKNITVVVTRYFGGIKLGAGGLIRAYSGAVSQGAQAIGLVKRVKQQELIFSLPYSRYDELNHYLKAQQIAVSDVEYGVAVTLHVYLDFAQISSFVSDMENLLAGKFDCQKGQEAYREIDI